MKLAKKIATTITISIMAVFLVSMFAVWAEEPARDTLKKNLQAQRQQRQNLREQVQDKKQELKQEVRDKKQELKQESREGKQEGGEQEFKQAAGERKKEVRQEIKAQFQDAKKSYKVRAQELQQLRKNKLQSLKDANKEAKLAIIKEHLLKTADQLMDLATQIQAKAEASPTLTEEESKAIRAEMEERITRLNEAKTQIHQATTLEQVKIAAQYIHRNISDIKRNLQAHVVRLRSGTSSQETTTTLFAPTTTLETAPITTPTLESTTTLGGAA